MLLRYDYDPKSLLLRICPMPKAAHNALEGFLTKTLIRLRCQNALTEAEEDELELNFGTAINLPYRDTTARVGRKPPATAKQPDAAITLMTGIDSLFPRVVFEVGFSQTYDELFDDVRQWLERSEGAIPVAILIYIEEHPIESAPDGNTTDDESTLHSDDSEASDVALYRRLRASCDVDRYVGLISAFAEVFRFGPTGVYRDGTRVVRTPSSCCLLKPKLTHIEHHITPEHRTSGACGVHIPQHHGSAPACGRRPRDHAGHGGVCARVAEFEGEDGVGEGAGGA